MSTKQLAMSPLCEGSRAVQSLGLHIHWVEGEGFGKRREGQSGQLTPMKKGAQKGLGERLHLGLKKSQWGGK